MNNVTKGEIVVAISETVGFSSPGLSTGSTEPASLFVQVIDSLGLGSPENMSKPQMAKFIVESSGQPWLPEYESSGGTVTKRGLLAVLSAVKFFTR